MLLSDMISYNICCFDTEDYKNKLYNFLNILYENEELINLTASELKKAIIESENEQQNNDYELFLTNNIITFAVNIDWKSIFIIDFKN